jgi:hypothetical protein
MMVLVTFSNCEKDIVPVFIEKEKFSQKDSLPVIFRDYNLMEEKIVTISSDSTVLATYINPVTRYKHGILGDAVEAGSLAVYFDKQYLILVLKEEYVFEDIAPRLVDIDRDGLPEIICIRSQSNRGAGIVIYKITNKELTEYAWVNEIGTPNRWLNIASIGDLNANGNMEIIWVQTPHIGGILKVAEINKGALEVLDQSTLYSNHAIGEKNLCLSVLTKKSNQLMIHLPSHDRKEIVSLIYNGKLKEIGRVTKEIDFAKSLLSQYDFKEVVKSLNNCD